MKMKFWILMTMVIIMGSSLSAHAMSAGDQGFGILLGSPSGVSGKFWFSDVVALDMAAGVERGDLDIHADFLFHEFSILREANFPGAVEYNMPLYIGIGPRVLFRDDSEFGLRLPIGSSMFIPKTPWEIFGELVPVLRFTPSSGMNFEFGVGARYYFEAIRPRG